MNAILTRRWSQPKQFGVAIALVVCVSAVCFVLSDYIGYKAVALLLLMTVSLVASLFGIMPVLVAAALSALVWDFFFIPPRFTFTVGDTEDALMLAMYFVVASVNAVLMFQIRRTEKAAQQEEEKENTLKLYNTLLNSLSHELRTPIATIIGATDNLQSGNERLTTENKSELLGEISKASLRLNRQVENLLNMSRIESGVVKPKMDWVDVNELVHDVVNRLKEFNAEHPVNVQVREGLPLFKLDYGLMEAALYNLVYNAVLYIPKYCTITVRAACVNDRLVLQVEDNGPGFPPAERKRVFEKFYRLRESRAGGSGLGLSIVKGFVEAHKGTVTLESFDGTGGAKFTIDIPAAASYINNLKHE